MGQPPALSGSKIATGLMGGMLAVLLGLQVGLGVVNVMMTLPMPVVVARNGGAAALLVMMVVINFALSRTGHPA